MYKKYKKTYTNSLIDRWYYQCYNEKVKKINACLVINVKMKVITYGEYA